MVLTCEIGDIRRFGHPSHLMAYVGLVPSQHSSGNRTRHGAITKTGNTFAREVLVSSALHYRFLPRRSRSLKDRQACCSPEVIAISWKAQKRLHKSYQQLKQTKYTKKVNVAVGRELVGFLWAAMQTVAPEETTPAQ